MAASRGSRRVGGLPQGRPPIRAPQGAQYGIPTPPGPYGHDTRTRTRPMDHARTAACLIACLAALSCDVPRVDPGGAPDASTPSSVATPALAVTIDDLPWIGALRPGESRGVALQRMIDALVARDVPAMAFPNCDRAGAGAPLLRQWLDAGLDLGNHTAAHLDLNRAPLQQWLRDARTCHDMIRELTGSDTIWFRYPFLHQGPDPERQQAVLGLLAELRSPIAHVTIDNSDWILAVAYGEAVTRRDSVRAAAIADAFVEHVLRATGHYQQVAHRKIGRDVRHVLLLHANLLVADNIGRLLDALAARGFRFISVAEAHRDSIYDLPDEYTGMAGLSWLYRMRPATPEEKAWDDAEAARLRARWR
jgi:peptidoglycan-N-acetylglucosamine deacetylase